MLKILTLNNISETGLKGFPTDAYVVGDDIEQADAILLRSFDMHDMALPPSLKVVGRAGAGVNNIPVGVLASLGIPVFNAPGANANAVKELVLAGMLLAARNICPAWEYARGLSGNDEHIKTLVEAGKKKYAGAELAGKVLGVVGLGAIGRRVAKAASGLGMTVVGLDPKLTVDGAWKLSSQVHRAESIEALLAQVDFVSVHVPLVKETRDLLNTERIAGMRKGAVILNFARGGIVNDTAVIAALKTGLLKAYVCDFPSKALLGHEGVIALPHLGASTQEAEENCARMVVEQVRGFLEHGNIVNAVNFPEVLMARTNGFRVAIINSNVPNMLGQISSVLADNGLNIVDMMNKSRGEMAYTLVDVHKELPAAAVAALQGIEGVSSVRVL